MLEDNTAPLSDVREGYVVGADNVRLFYRAIGMGPETVIVLHGGPGLHMNYLVADLEPLGMGRRLLFYDQRGAGRSDVITDADQFTTEHYVRDLETLRQHFQLERMALLGHSWGAGVALFYALEHPAHVERLVLVDPLPPRATPYMQQFGANIIGRIDAEGHARLEQLGGDEPVAIQREYWNIVAPAYFADPRAVARMRGDLTDTPPETVNPSTVYGHTLASLGDWDWRPLLAGMQVPTLILHGAQDPIPPDSASEWAATLPDARLLVMEQDIFHTSSSPNTSLPRLRNSWLVTGQAVRSYKPIEQ